MRKLIIFIALFTSLCSFSSGRKLKGFLKCKKEMREFRNAYAYDIAYGGDYFLNSGFFSDISRIPDLIYMGNKAFSYRPWLKDISLDKKLSSCKEVHNQLRIHYGEPLGVNSLSRDYFTDADLVSSSNGMNESSEAFSR